MSLRTASFLACGAIALFAVAIALRGPRNSVVGDDASGDSQSLDGGIEASWPGGADPTANTQPALAEEDRARLAELQGEYTPGELDELFNPPTTVELERSIAERLSQPFDAHAYASRKYDEDGWSGLVDEMGLAPEDARRARDAWIALEARKSELYDMVAQGLVDPLTAGAGATEAETRFLSQVSGVFSPEQLRELENHERQILAENAARIQAEYQEMIDGGYTGIVVAAGRGDLPSVRAHLDSGADPNQISSNGETALHNAAWYNETEIMRV